VKRGEIWWASLPEPVGSGPGFRRPVVVVQSDPFNESRIGTVVIAAISSNLHWALSPGNVRLSRRVSKLARESVVNVSQLLTVDKTLLTQRIARLGAEQLRMVDDGLRLVLGL
jgi:mRNA interferase MazF